LEEETRRHAERERQELEEKQRLEKQQAQQNARKAAAEETGRQRLNEEADRKVREEAQEKQKATKVTPIHEPKKRQPRPSKQPDTQVWRGSALPAEVSRPQPEMVPAPSAAS